MKSLASSITRFTEPQPLERVAFGDACGTRHPGGQGAPNPPAAMSGGSADVPRIHA
jgi:hypothetical protein